MTKKLVWIGMFVGSTIGNMLPLVWGGTGLLAGLGSRELHTAS